MVFLAPWFCRSVQSSVMSDSLWPHGLRMPGFPVRHQLLELAQTQSPWCHPAVSSSVMPFLLPQSCPASGSFPVSQLFVSGGQSIGVSGSASWEGCSVDLKYLIRSFNLDWIYILGKMINVSIAWYSWSQYRIGDKCKLHGSSCRRLNGYP